MRVTSRQTINGQDAVPRAFSKFSSGFNPPSVTIHIFLRLDKVPTPAFLFWILDDCELYTLDPIPDFFLFELLSNVVPIMAPKKESDGLSAFERRRLENIAANKALLSEISVTAKNIIPDKPVSKPSAPRKRTRAEPVLREPRRGTRMSSRLAGVSANDDVLKRKLEVESEHQASENKAKRLRSGDDMNLGDIVVDGRKYTSSMDGLKGIFRGAQPGMRTFSDYDIKETTDANLKELRSQMSGLKLYEHWIPNGKYYIAFLLAITLVTSCLQISRSPRNEYTH